MLSHLVPNFSKLVVATVVDNMIPKSGHLAIWDIAKQVDITKYCIILNIYLTTLFNYRMHSHSFTAIVFSL